MQITQCDITTVIKGVVAHQVNCLGYMGCGVALAIRRRWPQVYERYRTYGKITGTGLWQPGNIQMIQVDYQLWIANLAGQDGISRTICMTDYFALEACLAKLAYWREHNPISPVYFPYRMGCNNAGGDWNIVEPMIVRHIPDVIFCKGIKD